MNNDGDGSDVRIRWNIDSAEGVDVNSIIYFYACCLDDIFKHGGHTVVSEGGDYG